MSGKIRKLRGRKTGYGSKKKHRGAGNRGGRGKAGRGKHKRSWIIKNAKNYFKKPSMTSLKTDVGKTINLDQIDNLAVKNDLKEVELKGYKVLGRGSLSSKISIKADSFGLGRSFSI